MVSHSSSRMARPLLAAVACVFALFTVSCLSACQTSAQPPQESAATLDASATIEPGVLTVGVNASNSPYGGTNSSGDIVGLDVDVASAIADELGLKLKVVDVKAEGKKQLADKQVDVALGMTKSGNDDDIVYSKAYINDGSSLFMMKDKAVADVKAVDFHNLGGQKVVVQSSSSSAYEVQEALGLEAVTAVATMKDAFESLQNGTSSYLVADAVIGDYFARNYGDIVDVGYLSSVSVKPVYATTLSANSALAQAVTQAVEDIGSDGTVRVIAAKWLGEQSESLLPGKVDMSTLPDTFASATAMPQGTEAAATTTQEAATQGTQARDADAEATAQAGAQQGDDDGGA